MRECVCTHTSTKKQPITHIRGAVTKFPELWYSTVMVGHMTTLDLITFKVRPSLTYTLAPSILPLLDALAGGFFWNLP